VAKVLIADDNALTLRSIQLALEVIGFEVVATSDPLRVVELAATAGVDAVVLDVMMPELSGYDVIHLLRGRPDTASLPVVFLSGLGHGEDRVRGLREGADDYLVKPFEPAELALRIERLIARRAAVIAQPSALGGAATAAPEISAADITRLEECMSSGAAVDNLRLGRYQILLTLGEGATGTVFRGWDTRLQRTVALKTIRLSRQVFGTDRDELIAGLLREAVAAARVQHPNIIAVHDVVDAGSLAFIIMEFVNGMNLEQYVRQGRPLVDEQVVPLAAAMARALAAAHAHRIIHHDLKPANVLLGRDGSVKISDFGIAEFVSSLYRDRGRVFGTPGFVAPECLAGAPYDEKADLFALGVTLYVCLTSTAPFAGATLDETMRNTLLRDPPRPGRPDRPVMPEVEELVMSLLSRERTRRPVSAAHVAGRFERVAEQHGLVWSPSMAVMERPGLWSSEHRSTLLPTTGV